MTNLPRPTLPFLVAALLAVALGCGPTEDPPPDAGPEDGGVDPADGGAPNDGGGPTGDAAIDAAIDGGDDGGTDPGDAGAPEPAREARIAGRAVVDWADPNPSEPWWIEERLAPWPRVEGDRDPGVRRLVRAPEGGAPVVVYEPPSEDRLTDAVRHPSGEWSAVGVGADRRPFLVRGSGDAVVDRRTVDDPGLAADRAAWLGEVAPEALEVGVLSEDSVRVSPDGEDVVVTLMSRDNAVLAYRWHREAGAWRRGPRTLVSPAHTLTPFLPMGGSYDDFDAMVGWFLVFAGTDAEGDVYVAHWVNRGRLLSHNAAFGTDHTSLVSTPGIQASDVLVTRVGRDGSRVWSRVVGTTDLDDEPYGIAVGAEGVAVVGRHRLEPGVSNAEWHLMVALLDLDGGSIETRSRDVLDSGITLCAAFAADGSLYLGGSEAWRQNPEGFSLFDEGQPFLLRLRDGVFEDRSDRLPATAGHAELRALAVAGGHLFSGGLENGPLTHTGDTDPSRIRADGFWIHTAAP